MPDTCAAAFDSAGTCLWLADGVLLLHASIAAFIVVGLPLIVVGNQLHWQWVNGLAFRGVHLLAIAIVVAESWLGWVCPLTTLEMRLRACGGGAVYGGSFIEHWVQRVLYWDGPPWAFAVAYTLFAALVVATWVRYPPRRRRR
jgi:polyferredoxin